MLAIAQSHNQYHYLNWIPSESGPIVTHYGKVIRNQESIITINTTINFINIKPIAKKKARLVAHRQV